MGKLISGWEGWCGPSLLLFREARSLRGGVGTFAWAGPAVCDPSIPVTCAKVKIHASRDGHGFLSWLSTFLAQESMTISSEPKQGVDSIKETQQRSTKHNAQQGRVLSFLLVETAALVLQNQQSKATGSQPRHHMLHNKRRSRLPQGTTKKRVTIVSIVSGFPGKQTPDMSTYT